MEQPSKWSAFPLSRQIDSMRKFVNPGFFMEVPTDYLVCCITSTIFRLSGAKISIQEDSKHISEKLIMRKTPVTHSQMYRLIAAGFLIWKIVSDLQIIFYIRVLVRKMSLLSLWHPPWM